MYIVGALVTVALLLVVVVAALSRRGSGTGKAKMSRESADTADARDGGNNNNAAGESADTAGAKESPQKEKKFKIILSYIKDANDVRATYKKYDSVCSEFKDNYICIIAYVEKDVKIDDKLERVISNYFRLITIDSLEEAVLEHMTVYVIQVPNTTARDERNERYEKLCEMVSEKYQVPKENIHKLKPS